MRKLIAFWALVLVLVASPLHAGTVSNCTDPDLRAQVQNGGHITFACDGIISLTGPLAITKPVILDATGRNIILTPTGSSRVFEVATNGTLTVTNVAILGGRNGTDGGGAIFNRGTVQLVSCLLSNNVVTAASGTPGKDSDDGGLNGGSGKDGGAGRRIAGGAVFNRGRFYAIETGFFGNSAVGGMGAEGGAGHRGEFKGGSGGSGGGGGAAFGGAIYNAGILEVYACGFDNNSVLGGDGAEGGPLGDGAYPGVDGRGGRGGMAAGGAIYSTNRAIAVIRGCTFSLNSVFSGTSAPGGMSRNSGKVGQHGQAAYGGGVCNYGLAVVVNSTFFENEIQAGNGGDGDDAAFRSGDGGNGGNAWGGSYFNGGNSLMTNCTFSGGAARPGTNGLPGIGDFTGKLGQRGTTRGANIGHGKGKFILSHTILTNVPTSTAVTTNYLITLTTNIIQNVTGGTNAEIVLCTRTIALRVDLSVIRDTLNCQTNGLKGSNLVASVTTDFKTNEVRTQITDNRSNVYGSFKDGGYNLLSDKSMKIGKKSTTKLNMDPILGPLQDNGGPTETMEPLRGPYGYDSPAIDGGSPTFHLPTDQRGALRPTGYRGDIGAFEADGEIADLPAIATQPVNNTVEGGSDASFLVVADGSEPLVYQWYRVPNIPVTGGDDALLTIPRAHPTNAGGYFAIVSNGAGSATSIVATLTVNAQATAITADLADRAAYLEETVALTFATTGTPSPAYQWFYNGAPLVPGVTGSTLFLTNVQPAQAGNYQAIATNLYGSVTSRVATLTVNEGAPVLVSQPTNVVAYTGEDIAFNFITAGGPAPVYQWYFNGTNSVAGATGATLILTNVQSSNIGTYEATATNVHGSLSSQPASLTAVQDSAPFFTRQPPAATNVAVGATLVLSPVTRGNRPMTFQWHFVNPSSQAIALPGATNETLVISNFSAANEGVYTLHAVNALGDEYSDQSQVQRPQTSQR